MKIRKVTIRVNETGWVVYFGTDVDNFHVFRSDEATRFVKFIAEKVGSIKLDALLKIRDEEIARAREKFEQAEQPK